MARAVHKFDGKIALQIAHAGLFADSQLIGGHPLGPSPMRTEKGTVGRAMTGAEINRTVEAFGRAAAGAQKAGFDVVQIHGAHGFLLSQFLSLYYNKRADEFGGLIENRARFLILVYKKVRNAVGESFPVLVKLSSQYLLDGSFTCEDLLKVCAMLQEAGTDAIELSGGTVAGFTFAPVDRDEVYWRKTAEQYKAEIDIPLMLVGGVRSLETAEELVVGGVADYVCMCRPFVREPDLVARWQRGDRRAADCMSDNACGYAAIEGNGLHCVHLGN